MFGRAWERPLEVEGRAARGTRVRSSFRRSVASPAQEPVASPKDVTVKLDAAKKDGKNLLFLINRHGVNQFVALNLGAAGKG